MGLFDRFKKDKGDISNPPDFSKFDDSLGNDPFADSTGLDRELGQSSQTNRQELMNTQSQVRQQTNNEPIIRNEPSAMKLPGSYREEDNSNFNHDLFNNQQQSQQENNNSSSGVVYQEISHRQADLILERLETIKAELDAIKQRMKHIEMLVDHRDRLNTQKRYL